MSLFNKIFPKKESLAIKAEDGGIFLFDYQKGMSWEEFCNSKYNNGWFSCVEDSVYFGDYEIVNVNNNDKITEKYLYKIHL